MTALFIMVHNAANVNFGNIILNTLNGIKLQFFEVLKCSIETEYYLLVDKLLPGL